MTWNTARHYKDWYVITGIYFPKEYCEFVKENWKKSKEDKPTEEEYRKKLKEIVKKYEKKGRYVSELAEGYIKDE
tara:strand:- start:400 stop:624 length:225 start_codon:yes stop_codon:yes gene_type:complete